MKTMTYKVWKVAAQKNEHCRVVQWYIASFAKLTLELQTSSTTPLCKSNLNDDLARAVAGSNKQ